MDFGARGRPDEILNGLSFMAFVRDINLLLTNTIVNGPSHRRDRSQKTVTKSPGRMRYMVAVGRS